MSANANIAGWLTEMAQNSADRKAVIGPQRSFVSTTTFRELEESSNQVAGGLKKAGVSPGMRIAVMIPPDDSFARYIFALFKLGAIPVLIDGGIGLRGIGRCIETSAPEAFIGTNKAYWARWLFRWGKQTIRHILTVVGNQFGVARKGVPIFWEELSSDANTSQRSISDPAAILFTSGSTGPAKGAVYTHGMFQEQVRVLREVFSIEPGEVDLCTFPLFALFAPALGMTSIVPDMDPTRPAKADPKKLIKAIIDYQATNLFGSPALINVLSRYGEKHDIRLPSLRRVISAGAPVPASVIERMTKMLNPGVQVFTPYGATEALPIAVIGSDEILNDTRHITDQGAGICVGKPVGRIEVAIIPIEDGPVHISAPSSGELGPILIPPPLSGGLGGGDCLATADSTLPFHRAGEICVRGPVVSRTYWNRPDADALHKIPDGNTVWHRTGDIGYFDDSGRLWFCGRKAHRVVLPDQTLFTIPVEAVFNVHPDVFRTALVGVAKYGVTRPVLCVELEKQCSRSHSTIVPELETIRDRFPHTATIREFLFHKGFPVDIRHNAKINREKLAIWAARRLR